MYHSFHEVEVGKKKRSRLKPSFLVIKITLKCTLLFSRILTQKNKPILIFGWGVGTGYVDVIIMRSSPILWCI